MFQEKDIFKRCTSGTYEALKDIKITIVGAGGIGSNVAATLVRSGATNIKIIDYDKVELSNLNRQQYFLEDVGKYKVLAIKDILKRINPNVNIDAVAMKLSIDNFYEYLKDTEIIVEAFDNAEYKAELTSYVLKNMKDKYLIASSGMANIASSNDIKSKKIKEKFYICGDFTNEVTKESGVMASRVLICANHMANMVIRIAMEKFEV